MRVWKQGSGGRAVLIAAGAVLLSASMGRAAVVVNDTWQDADRTQPAQPVYSEYGTDADADGNIESAWFNGGTGATATASAGHLVLTPSAANSASWTTYFTPEASPINLANQGDQLKVTWIFTPNTVNTANTSQNFRLAVVDSPSAIRLTADGSPGSAAYTGYAMFMNMAQTLGNSNPYQLRDRDGTSAALLSASTPPWNALANGATSGNHGYDSGTQYTFVMTMTHNASDGLDVVATMTGGTLNTSGTATVSFADTTHSQGFTFDTFALRPSNPETTAASFDTTLFKVEGPVPEPSSLALLSIGSLTLLRRRRRA